MDAYWFYDEQDDSYVRVPSTEELESRSILSSIEEYESYNNQSCEFDS
jgi:hypothetical protein